MLLTGSKYLEYITSIRIMTITIIIGNNHFLNPTCSGVLSNLYVLGGRAFLTSIDTQCFLFS